MFNTRLKLLAIDKTQYFKGYNSLRFIKNSSTTATAKVKQSKYKSVVGLEIHCQILTKSKLFSGAEAKFASPANTCVSAFDASIPGTLPVLNQTCVEAGVKTALALECDINPISMFDRKHYFYADLPTGYQITQQRAPLANNGMISFHICVPGAGKKSYKKTVRLHQLQLEQDSGKSLHDPYTKKSLVDLNRAGIPLMELVFEPDLTNGEEAAALVKELVLILTKLKTCSCKMEEGALRVDANVSINKVNEPLGTRTEVKNIGSIRGVADSITYEINRQMELVDAGGIVTNETRSWDAINNKTIPMRDKEVLQDYRFMPEPNLPPLHLNINGKQTESNEKLIDVLEIRKALPELPEETRQKLMQTYGVAQDVAVILLNEPALLEFFQDIVKENKLISPKVITNLLINDFLSFCNKYKIDVNNSGISSKQLRQLMEMLHCEEININLARLILQEMLLNPQLLPNEIAAKNNWKQINDVNDILKICQETLKRNPELVVKYQNGKEKILFALAGDIFKQTEQRANMAMVIQKLKELLRKPV